MPLGQFTLTSDRFSCIPLTSQCSELSNPQTGWQCPPKHTPLTTEAYLLCNPAHALSESLAVRCAGFHLVSVPEAASTHQGINLAQGTEANDEGHAIPSHVRQPGEGVDTASKCRRFEQLDRFIYSNHPRPDASCQESSLARQTACWHGEGQLLVATVAILIVEVLAHHI
jgi:hypothetical protein